MVIYFSGVFLFVIFYQVLQFRNTQINQWMLQWMLPMLLVSLEKYMQILILSSYLGCVSVIIAVKILYLKIDILTEIFFCLDSWI